METWVAIPSAPGYEVSDAGRVRSLDRVAQRRSRWGGTCYMTMRGRVLKPWLDANGYPVVYLCTPSNPRWAVNVHRIVAEAFLEAVPGKEFVNHKDGVKTNGAAGNLEWCTREENMAHAYATGLCEPARPVLAISGDTVRRYESAKAACADFGGLSKLGHIKSALCGLKPTAYGHRWQYA